MVAVIGWIAARTGLGALLSSLIAYAIVAALAGGGIWAWSAHRYNVGYAAGEIRERTAWQRQRAIDLAKQAADIADKQRKIDQIEADYHAAQQELEAAKADAALEAAIRKEAADQKPAIPKSIAKALNGVR
jgi:biopolymer transport protein ExbB/TolQ